MTLTADLFGGFFWLLIGEKALEVDARGRNKKGMEIYSHRNQSKRFEV